jgi:hypothetical protein
VPLAEKQILRKAQNDIKEAVILNEVKDLACRFNFQNNPIAS